MTTVTIIGEAKPIEKKKPIEFVKYLDSSINFQSVNKTVTIPTDYKFIELIRKSNSNQRYDIMFAYDYDRSKGVIYLGHFNDGIVEGGENE